MNNDIFNINKNAKKYLYIIFKNNNYIIIFYFTNINAYNLTLIIFI